MLDITKPLYDEMGRAHAVVTSSRFQVVTRWGGCFGVWDRRDGTCLIVGCEGTALSNTPPPAERVEVLRREAGMLLASLYVSAALDRASAHTQ